VLLPVHQPGDELGRAGSRHALNTVTFSGTGTSRSFFQAYTTPQLPPPPPRMAQNTSPSMVARVEELPSGPIRTASRVVGGEPELPRHQAEPAGGGVGTKHYLHYEFTSIVTSAINHCTATLNL
jgi:hypothetical protein